MYPVPILNLITVKDLSHKEETYSFKPVQKQEKITHKIKENMTLTH